MIKKHNIIILEEDLHKLSLIAKDKKIALRGKKVYQIDIKYIQPNRFDDRIYERNWLFALDILQNGDAFEEVYILVLKKKEDLKTLSRIQQMIIKGSCEDFSNILD